MKFFCTAVLALFLGMAGLSRAAGQESQPAQPQTSAQPSPSQQPAYHLPPDKLAKAVAYSRERSIFHFVDAFWGLVVLWLLLSTGLAAQIEAWAKGRSQRRWIQGEWFFIALLVVLTLTELPMDMWAEHESLHYGVSVQSWGSWFGDQGKALGLTLVFAPLIMLLFQWIVKKWTRRYWLGIWLVTLPLMVLLVFVSPLFEPIFNKYEPLGKNHAGLVAELEKVVQRTGTNIPPDRMFLMKASEKTNGLNAYVNGIGATKRIVVWDTTADRVPDDVVMFVFGHESGHYVLNHIPKELSGMAVFLFFLYWGCAAFANWLARQNGAKWGLDMEAPMACRAGFVVLLFAISLASLVTEPASNAFSRHFEHEADVYGQEAIHGLVADPQKTAVNGFNALGEAYLEDPNPSPFIEFWEYNHPSVKTRAEFAAQYDPWKNGGKGRFFPQ